MEQGSVLQAQMYPSSHEFGFVFGKIHKMIIECEDAELLKSVK